MPCRFGAIADRNDGDVETAALGYSNRKERRGIEGEHGRGRVSSTQLLICYSQSTVPDVLSFHCTAWVPWNVRVVT